MASQYASSGRSRGATRAATKPARGFGAKKSRGGTHHKVPEGCLKQNRHRGQAVIHCVASVCSSAAAVVLAFRRRLKLLPGKTGA